MWFLLPLIAEENNVLINNKIATYQDYAVESSLINSYLYGYEDHKIKNPIYLKYRLNKQTLHVEDTLNKGLVSLLDETQYSVYVYSIQNTKIYEQVKQGKYSELDENYKRVILRFFNFTGEDSHIHRIFRREPILWHSLNKELGCMRSACMCKINKSFVRTMEQANMNQEYLSCKYFHSFGLPKKAEVIEKPNVEKETLIL